MEMEMGAGGGSSDPDLSHQRRAGTARSLYQQHHFTQRVGSAPSVPASYTPDVDGTAGQGQGTVCPEGTGLRCSQGLLAGSLPRTNCPAQNPTLTQLKNSTVDVSQ